MNANFHAQQAPVRVVLCSYAGIYSSIVKKVLQNTDGVELAGIVHSHRIFSKSETWLQGAVRLLKTCGLEYTLVQFIQTDLYLFLSKFFNRQTEKIPTFVTKDINDKQGWDFLTQLKPDVILLANFNQKVSIPVISLAKLACLNIHPSLLPQYKGVDPVFVALNAGENTLGVTVHQVAEDFDTGDLYAQSSITVKKNHSAFYHQVKLFQQGALLAAQTIQQLRLGIQPKPQSNAGHYDSWPKAEQIKAFKQKGGFLISYSEFIAALKDTVLAPNSKT